MHSCICKLLPEIHPTTFLVRFFIVDATFSKLIIIFTYESMGVVSNLIKDLFELQCNCFNDVYMWTTDYLVRERKLSRGFNSTLKRCKYICIYIYTHVLLKSDLRRLYILTSFPHVDRQLICVRGGRVGLRSDLRGFISVVFIAVKSYNIFHQQLES